MKNETHEDRVKILEGAPDDATHFDADGDYIYYDSNAVWGYYSVDNKWYRYAELVISSRSLSDIQKLVDMQNEIDELREITGRSC